MEIHVLMDTNIPIRTRTRMSTLMNIPMSTAMKANMNIPTGNRLVLHRAVRAAAADVRRRIRMKRF